MGLNRRKRGQKEVKKMKKVDLVCMEEKGRDEEKLRSLERRRGSLRVGRRRKVTKK